MDYQLQDTKSVYGVVVRLADPIAMNDLIQRTELSYHSKAGHRIWMYGEFEVLTNEQVVSLKKKWGIK
jgi:hypothetical protein